MAEYTPSGEDERIAHAYAEVIYHGSEGMVSREEGVAEFYAYLAAHDSRVRRDAWQEGSEQGYADAAELDRNGFLIPDYWKAETTPNPYPETEDQT